MTTKTTAKATAKVADVAKGVEDVTAFGQQNVDAIVKATEVAKKAAESLTGEFTSFSKKSFEDMVAAAQDLTTAKTPVELVEKQTVIAKSVFEGFIAQATKMNELYMAAAKDMSAPLNERFVAASESMKSFAA